MSSGGQPGGDGGGQPGGGQPGGNAATSPVPWASAGEGQIWTIGDKPWYETAVPEGPARELFRAKKYANPSVVATSYAELERANSSRDDSKMVRLLDDNAKPEDVNAFYEKLGRPKDVSGYKDVKWGDNADPMMKEFGANLAFKLGLSPKATESILAAEWNTFVGKMNGQQADAEKTAGAQALAQLKADWKGDFDANKARGQQVLQSLAKAGMTESDLASIEKHVGIAPVVKLLATIGKLSGEGRFMEGSGTGNNVDPASMTPEQAKGEISRKTMDKDFQKAYMGKSEPGHAEAVKLMEGLYKKAGPLMGGAA
jgi:hypothetical protein